MSQKSDEIDFRNWDWLPKAADEIQAYLVRLLTEASITPHDVSARAKSISSFLSKQEHKQYSNPVREVTDSVAVRIITYSNTDWKRSAELIRDRFTVKSGEDRNPGNEKPINLRGYDCQHIVIAGEKIQNDSGWLITGGELSKYFDKFGGLEIQIRTVAAHAWAEFEHARRYKGALYKAVSEHDKATIDQLFGAASDSRRALDETFVAIDRILANPTMSSNSGASSLESPKPDATESVDGKETLINPLTESALTDFLASRFPEDKLGSHKGIEFACEIVRACGFETIDALESALEAVDSEQVRSLMESNVSVTRVRRLDDELLARFGEDYAIMTGSVGNVKTRAQQLEWRFDRLRGKTQYRVYSLEGSACPEELSSVLLPGTRTVREVARVVANHAGAVAVEISESVSVSNTLLPSARAKEVPLANGESIWVATNLNRDYSESLIKKILSQAGDIDLQVMKDGNVIAGRSLS